MPLKPGTIKILDSFQIQGRGILTELQHFENGLTPSTHVFDKNGNSWLVKSRVFSGNLMIFDEEVVFDNEISTEHISKVISDEEKRREDARIEQGKRAQGIYWYLLVSTDKKQKEKPEPGSVLEIKAGPNKS